MRRQKVNFEDYSWASKYRILAAVRRNSSDDSSENFDRENENGHISQSDYSSLAASVIFVVLWKTKLCMI